MEPSLQETLWRRGWNDTKAGWRDWRFLLFWAVMSPTIGLFSGLLSGNPVLGAVVATLVVIVGLVLVWIGATASAPVKQRNEARQQILAKEAINLEVTVGRQGIAAMGGDLQGKMWVRFLSATITNPSITLPIGISAVWLEVSGKDWSHRLSPLSSAHRDSMESLVGLPIPSKDLTQIVYLQPRQSESGEYHFLEHDSRGTATTFGVEDSTGKLYEHHF